MTSNFCPQPKPNTRPWQSLLLASCLAFLLSGPVTADEGDSSPSNEAQGAADIASGRILDWPEFSLLFDFDDHVDVVSDIQTTWSLSNIKAQLIFFYAANHPDAEVAVATGVTHVSQMTDASALTYSLGSASKFVIPGEFVFLRNPTTGFYGAIRFDRIRAVDVQQYETDMTWYLQQDGSADFSSFVFSDGFESADLFYWSSTSP